MPFFNRSLAGPGYIVLNIIRGMNIIGLLAAITASVVMMIKTFVVSKFFIFDGASHVITAIFSIFLLLTETPLFRKYFLHNWPLLSPSHGFVTLGLLMIVDGCLILGNLNKDATSVDSLGLAFWQILISSGIVCFVLGFVNIIVSYIFRTRSLGVTARMVRAYGATAPLKVADVSADSYTTPILPQHTASLTGSVTRVQSTRSMVSRADSMPSYYGSRSGVGRSTSKPTRNISAPVNVDYGQFSKINATQDIQKPGETHPAFGRSF